MAVWKEIDGWTFELFPVDTPVEEFGLYAPWKALWDGKRKDGGLPAWRDFELNDFSGNYGWQSVEDILQVEPYDSLFRLWGTNLTRLYGRDLTGRRMREYEGDFFSDEDFEMSEIMVRDGVIRTCCGPIESTRQDFWLRDDIYGFIELPLADDGRTIDRFINFTVPMSSAAR